MQTTTAVPTEHTSTDATSRGTCTRFATEGQKSMDRGRDAVPRCRRPLPFPLARQMHALVGRRLPFLAEHDDLAVRCAVLAAPCPLEMRFRHENVKRQHSLLMESMPRLPLVATNILDVVKPALGTTVLTHCRCANAHEPCIRRTCRRRHVRATAHPCRGRCARATNQSWLAPSPACRPVNARQERAGCERTGSERPSRTMGPTPSCRVHSSLRLSRTMGSTPSCRVHSSLIACLAHTFHPGWRSGSVEPARHVERELASYFRTFDQM